MNPSLVLNIIDILSRKLWAFPLKDNTMPTVLSTYKKFLKSIGLTAKPKQVSVRLSMVEGDMQFAAQEFTSYNDSKQIATYVDAAKYDHHDTRPGALRGPRNDLREKRLYALYKAAHKHLGA